MNIITRQEAISKGLSTYFTGKPCKRGHVMERFTCNCTCKGCTWNKLHPEEDRKRVKEWKRKNREKVKSIWDAWAAKNIDKLIQKNNLWRKNNPKKVREMKRNDYLKNTDRYKEKARVWVINNRERYRQNMRNRKARVRNAEGTHNPEDIKNLLEVQNYKCIYCKTSLKKEYHIDHIIALINGGDNTRYNLQILCPTCNLRKNARNPIEFAQSMGLLL